MADHFLVGDQQLAAALEAVAGTAETLVAADVELRPSREDVPFAPDFPRFTNDEVSEDLAEAPDVVSGSKGSIPVKVQLKSSGVVGTVPAVGKYLRACGLKEEAVKTITIGAISGGDSEFAAGETYSATGGKTGIIEADITGAGTLYYIVTSGGDLADTDVVTANADSATCSSASAEYGVKYSPRSTGQETLTLQRAEKNAEATAGQDFLYRIYGAMGDGSIEAGPLDSAKFSADFQGPVELMGAGSFFTGAVYEATTPPKYINSTVQVAAVAVQAETIAFAFGNAVELEPDPTTTGGTKGFDRARVARRVPTINVPWLKTPTSDIDELAKLADGSKFAFNWEFGTSPNKVKVVAPYCQIRDWSAADRMGRRVAGVTLTVVRNDDLIDGDFAIYFL